MATTFTLFPNLPNELKILVWQTAAETHPPRTFAITQHPDALNRWTTRNSDDPGAPALLSTTTLSRSIALKHFKLAFGAVDNAPIWFNFQRDSLFMQRTLMTASPGLRMTSRANVRSLKADLAQVENLTESAIPFHFSRPADRGERSMGRFSRFESLKKIHVIWVLPYWHDDDVEEISRDLVGDVREKWRVDGKTAPKLTFEVCQRSYYDSYYD